MAETLNAREEMPRISLGPNCQECPVFNKCLAMTAMRGIAGLQEIVHQNRPLSPWAQRSLKELGLPADNAPPDSGSLSEIVAQAAQGCEGPITTKALQLDVPMPEDALMFPNSEVYAIETKGSKTSYIRILNRTSLPQKISEVDSEKGKRRGYVFGGYIIRLTWPERTDSPFGSDGRIDKSRHDKNMQEKILAMRLIIDIAAVNSQGILSPEQLRDIAFEYRLLAGSATTDSKRRSYQQRAKLFEDRADQMEERNSA